MNAPKGNYIKWDFFNRDHLISLEAVFNVYEKGIPDLLLIELLCSIICLHSVVTALFSIQKFSSNGQTEHSADRGMPM